MLDVIATSHPPSIDIVVSNQSLDVTSNLEPIEVSVGDAGPMGPAGPQGPQGQPGANGEAEFPEILDGGNF